MEQHILEDKRRRGERRFWSRIAKRYDSWIESAFHDQYEVYRSKFVTHISKDDVVLEIGTGTGQIALHIAKKCNKVIGIDISTEMIEQAKRKKTANNIANASFQVEDAYKLPFEDETFDKVICCNAYQVMKEPIRAIKESKRVLKNKGESLCITYCYGESTIFDRLVLIKWAILYGIPRYWTNFTCSDLKFHFNKAGFKIIEEEMAWKNPVVLFLRCEK